MLEGTRLYQACIDKWGKEHQIDKFIEEMAELVQAILKTRNHINKTKWFEHMLEETADVELMLDQFKYINRVYNQEIAEYKQRKIERLNKILSESK